MAETKSWSSMKPTEVKEKILELAKHGMSAEKIGLALRDQHAIPRAKLLGVRVKQVLQEANLWTDPEHTAYEKKVEVLGKHTATHKHDYTARRSFVRKSQHIAKLKKR